MMGLMIRGVAAVVAAVVVLLIGYGFAGAESLSKRSKVSAQPPGWELPRATGPGVNWNGFYVGAHGPYHFDNTEGYGIGAQVGANVHFQSGVVVGLELDYTKAWLDRNETLVDYGTLVGRLDQYGSIRGRLGYAFGNILVYGTTGWALGWAKFDLDVEGGTVDTRQVNGLVWGGGAEAKLANMSLKLEYLKYEFGSKGPAVSAVEQAVDQDVVRFGVNFPFSTPVSWGQ